MHVKPGGSGARLWRVIAGAGVAGLLLGVLSLIASLASGTSARHVAIKDHPAKSAGHGASATPAQLTAFGQWAATSKRWSGANRDTSANWDTPATTTPTNDLGLAVAVSGNTAVVAAPGVATNAGTAFIYERSGKTWHRAATLSDPRGQANDWYAWDVAIFSTKTMIYVAVGGNDTNNLDDLVYIYAGSGKSWQLEATLADPGHSGGADMFGDSIALSNTTLVVGAACYFNFTGEIWIFERSGRRWVLQAHRIDPLDTGGDDFGTSVAASGSTVLVGAQDGKAYIYKANSRHRWRLSATLHNPGMAMNQFGRAVAISGGTAVIGAPGEVPNNILPPPPGPGAAYVFRLSGTRWRLRQKLDASTGGARDEFGFAITMTGSNMLIGSPTYGTTNCGSAFVAVQSGGRWIIRKRLPNQNCTQDALFGFSVAQSNAIAVLGAPGTNSGNGAVYFRSLP